MLGRDCRRPLLGVAAVAIVSTPGLSAEQPAVAVRAFQYHHAHTLGTAMDLTVVAPSRADADTAERRVLAEIGRLQAILSTYEPRSEVARLNASPVNGPGMRVSPELIEVLQDYDGWTKRSDGAFSGHAGDLIALWKKAETAGQVPSDDALLQAATKCRAPAWEINEAAHRVRRVSDQQINIDSLGKGYILDKAVDAATRGPTRIKGLLLNIGGDIRTWGEPAEKSAAGLWAIGVQDPAHPELNAAPLTTVYVPGGRSVSSSGAYQRFYTIGGKKYSHILDARTGTSGRNPAATVVANDSATANALATICCSMKFTEAMELVRSLHDVECMIVTPDGPQVHTDGFKALQDPALAPHDGAWKADSPFPKGYKLSIDLQVAPTQHKPYVFAWVTDGAGHYVKTLAAFGNGPKYWRDMREWWKFARDDMALQNLTHATQRSGSYPLSWDGTDQKGKAVPLGTYLIWVEVAAEHGPYAARYAQVALGQSPVQATIGRTSAFADVRIAYGPAAGGK